MAETMMSFGNYRFSVESAAYQDFKRHLSIRWQSQERLVRQPALQFIGLGEETIELAGVIYPHYRGGLQQIEQLREEAIKGEPQLLVDGLGNVWGLWVVSSVEENQSFFLQGGRPLKQTFQLNLIKYGEDL